MSSETGYVINIPLYFDGNLERLKKNIEGVALNPMFLGKRKIKILVGLNQSETKVLSEDSIKKGIDLAKELLQTQLKDHIKSSDIEIINYKWTPRRGDIKGINYTDLRNRLFESKQNQQFYEEFLHSGNVNNIFYLTIDPDTKVSEEIFSAVESIADHTTQAPLVMVGLYDFHVKDPELFLEGRLNWEGFLAAKETKFDRRFKEVIASKTFEVSKYPYESITDIAEAKETDRETKIDQNILSLQHYRVKMAKVKKGDILESVRKLEFLYKKLKFEKKLSEETIDQIKKLEDQIGVENLTLKKSVKGSSILYPAEPVLFLNLFQRGRQFQLYDTVQANKDTSKKIWGSYARIEEGETLVSTIRQIFRKSIPALQGVEKPTYVSHLFTYTTEIPQRALEIPKVFLDQLPKTKEELVKILSDEESFEQLKKTIAAIFKDKCQTSLAQKFLEQRRRFITGKSKEDRPESSVSKPSPFSEKTGRLVYTSLAEYFSGETGEKMYMDLLLQEILKEIQPK